MVYLNTKMHKEHKVKTRCIQNNLGMPNDKTSSSCLNFSGLLLMVCMPGILPFH